MLKVIIVDDEILVRVGIKSCIDWEKNGFEVVGQAENGLKALELARQVQPDIILTDIKMPQMDGLELISTVRKEFPHIKIIVLSCYNELEFVKKAMKLGAEDYILKLSMEPESFVEVLLKVKNAVESEQSAVNAVKHMENEFRINKHVIKENLYRKIIDESISHKDFVKELAGLGCGIKLESYTMICCGIDDYINASAKSRLEDKYLLKFAFINILEEGTLAKCSADISEIANGEYIILMERDGQIAMEDLEKSIRNMFRKMNASLKEYLNLSVSFGVDMPSSVDISLKMKYEHAKAALDYRFYSGRESIAFYNGNGIFLEKGILFTFDRERELLERLNAFDAYGAKAVISAFINETYASKRYLPDKVRKETVEILHSLSKFAKRFDVELESILSSNNEQPLDFLMNTDTLLSIRDWFEEFVDILLDYVAGLKISGERPEILTLKRYVDEHMSENITLEKASKISNISKCYLSSVFKSETGENFTNYVNRVKMEKARELIQKSGIKTIEAAASVGITDESYFSKLFKKYIGVSPSRIHKC